jgi:hypothetical protein
VIPVALAPRLTGTLPLTATRDSDGDAAVTVDVRPNVRPPQRAQLILGDSAIDARPRTSNTATLEFDVADAPVGEFFVRVRIDGVDSLLVDRSVTPPVFDPDQKVVIS